MVLSWLLCRWGSIDPEGQSVFLTIIQSVTIKMTTDFCWVLAMCLALWFRSILSIPRPQCWSQRLLLLLLHCGGCSTAQNISEPCPRSYSYTWAEPVWQRERCLSNTVCAVRDLPEPLAVGCGHVTAYGQWALSRSDMCLSIQMGYPADSLPKLTPWLQSCLSWYLSWESGDLWRG